MCARARAVFACGGFGGVWWFWRRARACGGGRGRGRRRGASRRRYIAAPRGNTGRLLIERAALLAHFRRAARETSVARAARAGLTRYLGLGCGVLGAFSRRARFVCIHNTTTAAVVREEKSSGPTVARVARRTLFVQLCAAQRPVVVCASWGGLALSRRHREFCGELPRAPLISTAFSVTARVVRTCDACRTALCWFRRRVLRGALAEQLLRRVAGPALAPVTAVDDDGGAPWGQCGGCALRARARGRRRLGLGWRRRSQLPELW